MPFEGDHKNDIGMQLPEGPVCIFDCHNGALKSPEAIFEGGVQYFAQAAADGDRDLATRLTRTNMKSLPYWQAHPLEMLKGAEATPEEFALAMSKM